MPACRRNKVPEDLSGNPNTAVPRGLDERAALLVILQRPVPSALLATKITRSLPNDGFTMSDSWQGPFVTSVPHSFIIIHILSELIGRYSRQSTCPGELLECARY